MPGLDWQLVREFGVVGFVLLVLYLLVRTGDLRTRFEADAWEERARRAEQQVDALLPAVTALTQEVRALLEELRDDGDPDPRLVDDGRR